MMKEYIQGCYEMCSGPSAPDQPLPEDYPEKAANKGFPPRHPAEPADIQ